MKFKEVVQVKDLQADNIDLIQSTEEIEYFCGATGYTNDDYDYLYVVWDKAREGNIESVYGSYRCYLDSDAYKLPNVLEEKFGAQK